MVYDSALRSAVTGAPAGEEWGVREELLAQAVDNLSILASGYQRKGKPPVVPRPAGEGAGARVSSAAEIDAFFGG